MTGYQSKKDMAQDKLTQPAQEPDEWFEGWRVQDFHDACKKPEQEPVAWIQKDMECDDFDSDSVTCEKPARAADGWEWIPLYTTPPQPAQEPVGEVSRHGRDSRGRQWHNIYWYDSDVDVPHGTKLYTTPAQRPWVGLTDDEIQELRKNFATLPAIAAIEAKLKEKNNG
jgi:hypothetical protein